MTGDYGQNIVEVVSHARREAPDGLEFLGLTQLFLALAQGRFSSFARYARLGVAQFTCDCGHKPGEPASHDVVMCTRLHCRHGCFLFDHSCDPTEWQGVPALPKNR